MSVGEKLRLLARRGQFAEGINVSLIERRSIAMKQIVVPQLGGGSAWLVPPGVDGLCSPRNQTSADLRSGLKTRTGAHVTERVDYRWSELAASFAASVGIVPYREKRRARL